MRKHLINAAFIGLMGMIVAILGFTAFSTLLVPVTFDNPYSSLMLVAFVIRYPLVITVASVLTALFTTWITVKLVEESDFLAMRIHVEQAVKLATSITNLPVFSYMIYFVMVGQDGLDSEIVGLFMMVLIGLSIYTVLLIYALGLYSHLFVRRRI